jgi:hypothetical protein
MLLTKTAHTGDINKPYLGIRIAVTPITQVVTFVMMRIMPMKMTEEERARLCVAKFRDMSDEMLSEMPGTVMVLAEKYYNSTRKLKKMAEMMIKVAEHIPTNVMIEVMAELATDMVVHGDKTVDEVIANLEAMKDEVTH